MNKKELDVILISLIGKGKKVKDKAKGYQKTKYKFPDDKGTVSEETAFFGKELFKYLKENLKLNIKQWIIFGTSTSCWSEMIELAGMDIDNELENLYYKVFEEEDNEDGVSKFTLKEWEGAIGKYLGESSIHFIDVDPTKYSSFINALIELIPADKEYKIVFDLTHGYRHMPFVISFSLVYIANFKKIKEIDVYYGAFEMAPNNEVKPVLKIDFINELYSLSTAYNIYEKLGYFPLFLENIGIKDSDNVYFKLEMNRSLKRNLQKLIEELKEKEKNFEPYLKEPIRKIREDLMSLTNLKYLDERMVERAIFYFEKKQYLKSLILLYEAMIILAGRFYKISDYLNYEEREKIRHKAKSEIWGEAPWAFFNNEEEGELFNRLEYIRNAAVHGSNPNNNQAYLEDNEKFQNLFFQCINLYNKLKKRVD
ncbi:TIGR02221 family CRISPR-associated protein [Thermovenabulum sp.]|uniref:TIGR02221 family CRISPR-associated protein n=1 Tax=Thermovenabulum sp. TaxID=3100335 RepID=UPI003C7DAF0F